MIKGSMRCAVAIATALAASGASAQMMRMGSATNAAPGWYGGLEVGTARSSFGSDNVSSVLGAQGLGATGTTVDRTATDYSLYAGYRFNPMWSLEGGYVDLGKREFNTLVAAPGAGTLSGRSHPEGLFLRAVGTWPIADGWSVFGRAGVVNSRARLAGAGTGSAASFDEQTRWHASWTAGLGVSWTLNPRTDVLVAYDRWNGVQPDFSGTTFHVDTINAGIRYRF